MWKVKIGLLLVLAIGANHLIAQKGTQSPYSSLGLGERNYDGFALFSSMGGVSMGVTDSSVVNSNNPASYAFIGRYRPVFQIGMNGRFSTYTDANASTNTQSFGLNQFQLGIPIKKNWGLGLGLKPYTFTGYTITEFTIEDTDTTQRRVSEGAGGIRNANFGIAYRPVNVKIMDSVRVSGIGYDTINQKKLYKYIPVKKMHTVSFGVNGNYLFGTSQQIRSAEFVPSTASFFNSRVETGLRVSGLAYELGINYQTGFEAANYSKILSFGATFSPATEVRAFQDVFAKSYIGSYYNGESVSVIDTVQLITDDQGTILKPQALGLGLEYRVRPYQSGSLLKIGADFKMESWSSYSTTFSNGEVNGGLKDRMSVGLGLEWTPKWGYAMYDPDNGFFSKLHYRIGFNYAQTELKLTNNLGEEVGIENYGMSFGLGLPILTGNSNTNINFGVNLGKLGTTEGGLIEEQYMGAFVGIAITPQRNSLWFLKRKYD